METDVLRAQLEELFELEQLEALTRDLLRVDPEQVGGRATVGSFARALTEYCVSHDALRALAEAASLQRPIARPRLAQLADCGLPARLLPPDSELGDFKIRHHLGEGPLGHVYRASKDDTTWRLKILKPQLHQDPGALQRLLVVNRAIAAADIPGLPREVSDARERGLTFLTQAFVTGEPLASYISHREQLALEESILVAKLILEPLGALHDRAIIHGNLKANNVLIYRDAHEQLQIELQDGGLDRWSSVSRDSSGHALLAPLSHSAAIAPETLRDGVRSTRTDMYSFGVILYQMLTGRLPFEAATPIDVARAQLNRTADLVSKHAPAGRVSDELDEFIAHCLDVDPTARPENAHRALEQLWRLSARRSQRPPMPSEQLAELVAALVEHPLDADAAVALEAAVEEGAPAKRVASAFELAFMRLPDDSQDIRSAKLNLGFRAGRLYRSINDAEAAESVYSKIHTLDPSNPVAITALEDVRLQLGHHDALIESWLGMTESAETAAERCRAWGKIGHLYETVLEDPAQAIVAYTQAFCVEPSDATAESVERLAGDDEALWTEVLSACAEANQQELLLEHQSALLATSGRWYSAKLKRSDLALQAYQTLLEVDPASEEALAGLSEIYRKAQQWSELIQILMRRSDAAATPAEARELRYESGVLLATKLNDSASARQILEGVLEQDPTHAESNDALGKLLREAGDYEGYAHLLERWADASPEPDRLSLLCKAGGTYEAHLGAPSEAIALYKAVLERDPRHTGALRGLDRLYAVLGQNDELILNLQAQLEAAATPRQKLELHARIAALYEEEFLSFAESAGAFEAMLELDPGHENAMVGLARCYERLERWDSLTSLLSRHAQRVDDPQRRAALLQRSAKVLETHLDAPTRAIAEYESVLALEPENESALEAVARLRQITGDAAEAVAAIDILAERASTPDAKRDALVRASRILREQGDETSAITRLERALAIFPEDASLATELRALYLSIGDSDKVISSFAKELETATSDARRAELNAELAWLALTELERPDVVEEAFDEALRLDPECIRALIARVLWYSSRQRWLEATRYFSPLEPKLNELDPQQARQLVADQIKGLCSLGEATAAVQALDLLQSLGDVEMPELSMVADLAFESDLPQQAERLFALVIERFDSELSPEQVTRAHYRHAESVRRVGDLGRAVALFEDARDLSPQDPALLEGLALCHEAQQEWEKVWEVQDQLLDVVPGEHRADVLMAMGELAAKHLNDTVRATKSYVAALEARPDDRKLLTRLMQLYSADKDWARLVEIVVRLADFQEDDSQKAKYLMTAGMVNSRELGNLEAAAECFTRVSELDPTIDKAVTERIRIHRELGDHEAAVALLKERAKAASAAKDTDTLLTTFLALAEIFTETAQVSETADALEAARKLEPDNRDIVSRLTELYRQHADRYFDRAVELQNLILKNDPFRADAYKALRKLYTTAKNADAAWCLCQALYVLNLAEPDEEKFFTRMRSADPAYARAVLTQAEWALLTHADADPRLTQLFALIEPAILAGKAKALADFGYDSAKQVDLASHQYPIGRTLHYAAGVLGIPAPATFENTNDRGGLVNLVTAPPALSVGAALLDTSMGAQSLAFIAGRHLTSHRSGFYVRELVPRTSELRAWLFAAVKCVTPSFPLSPEIKSSVEQCQTILQQRLDDDTLEHLTPLVSELLQDAAALELKRWTTAVDFTADRAGFLLAHDLERAIELIRGGTHVSQTPSPVRTKELVSFAISSAYFDLRRRLGIALE